MKPSNLLVPFSWDACQPIIHDHVFYAFGKLKEPQDFRLPCWQEPDLFGNDHPVCIEYCSGNGLWIAEKAMAYPQINWIAVEKKLARVRKIWSKIKNLDLKNLFIVCGEAYKTTKCYFPSQSFSNAYINFPDPWPKRRHARNRLIQPAFIEEVWRTLLPGAVFSLVTDDPDYSKKMLEEMLAHPGFESCHPDPYFITDLSDYGTSYFEQLWREKGKLIRFHQFKKKM
jgi:tRNA (guanine-N7-)-methyltransferase